MSDVEVDLFGDPVIEPESPDLSLSRGRRITLRQRADVARGKHPLTGEPTRPDLGTCGDCALRVHYPGGNRSYPKCARPGVIKGHSATSDVRAWWPACPHHQPKGTAMQKPLRVGPTKISKVTIVTEDGREFTFEGDGHVRVTDNQVAGQPVNRTATIRMPMGGK